MLLPAAFGFLEDSYNHLKEHVQVWDVAGERQVEISVQRTQLKFSSAHDL